MSHGDPAVVVQGLTKRYGERTVVDRVGLEVRRGEVVALVGPNGAGKTTTVEIIEGYRRRDGGDVRVLGADPWAAGRGHRARIGLMLQAGGIDQRARPAETIRQYAAFHADPRDPDELVDGLGLRQVAATPFRRLSGGERQRLGFALALVGRPELLLLDEPTAGMDPEARAVVRARIDAERSGGTAILLTTHELADVERVADRIVVLVGGRVAAAGTARELAAALRPRLRFTLERRLDEADLAGLGRSLGAEVRPTAELGGYEVVDAEPTPALIASLSAWSAEHGLLVTSSRAVGGTLEDAYLDLVAAALADRTPKAETEARS
jgi:ABC-2 type transport system ATP-binding protein